MLVSIIIPVYNTEKFIEECIESALNQTYKEIEIIVVDDGSTDGSLKIIKKFINQIKIISKSNGGTASALNTGIKEMNGEWFKWLSADDVLYPNAIQDLVNSARKLKDKENYILYSNYDIINADGKILSHFIEPNYNEKDFFELNTILLDHYIGNATTSLIHKSAFDRYGMFDESVDFAEDYELWLRLCILNKFRLHLVPKTLAKYRIHDTQITAQKMDKALNNADKIRKCILDYLDKGEREKYNAALKKYNNSKSLAIKIRHSIRDIMFKILPKSTSNTILQEYLKRKQQN